MGTVEAPPPLMLTVAETVETPETEAVVITRLFITTVAETVATPETDAGTTTRLFITTLALTVATPETEAGTTTRLFITTVAETVATPLTVAGAILRGFITTEAETAEEPLTVAGVIASGGTEVRKPCGRSRRRRCGPRRGFGNVGRAGLANVGVIENTTITLCTVWLDELVPLAASEACGEVSTCHSPIVANPDSPVNGLPAFAAGPSKVFDHVPEGVQVMFPFVRPWKPIATDDGPFVATEGEVEEVPKALV